MRKTHSSLKNKNHKVSSNNWLKRHINDVYVQKSKVDGFRSRAAYKILEIHKKYNIFGHGGAVLDLGCAPGSWIQAVKKVSPSSKIMGIDLIKIDEINGAKTMQKDLYDEDLIDEVRSFSDKYDVVMSDISPNTTGFKDIDHLRIIDVCEKVFALAIKILSPKGTFICKVFQGGTEKNLLSQVKQHFRKVYHFKPDASRKESKEIYLVARDFIGREI